MSTANKKTFAECYAFGKAKEGTTLRKLQDSPIWAGKEILRSEDQYAPYDFYTNCGLKFELKSRNNKKASYWETVMPFAKGEKNGDGCIFLFNFKDGLYYIRFDKKAFLENDCRLEEFEPPERADGNPEPPALYWYIPHYLLRRVSDGGLDELPPSIKQRQQMATYNNLISV
jgi:hypothetical protein|nr:MAG: hypothetical protein [Lake Baikal virophage 7]